MGGTQQSATWTMRLVEQEKRRIKTELDGIGDERDAKGKLTYILERISELAFDDSGLGRLQRYIYIVSSLVHHAADGGLSDHQVHQSMQLAYNILRAQSLKPKTSLLSLLYGDLHIMRSQIFRKNGGHWQAAWEQHLALHLSGHTPAEWKGFQMLAMANRTLRLGHAELAIDELRSAQKLVSDERLLGLIRINIARALRLSDRQTEASEYLRKQLDDGRDDIPDSVARELQWEQMCLRISNSGDLVEVLKAVKRGASHYRGSYVIESALWCMAVKSKHWLSRMPNLESLKRRPELNMRDQGWVLKAASALQAGYDYDRPLTTRFEAIGDCLAKARETLSLSSELLIWAAAARWLLRSKAYPLAAITLQEYESLCLTLTRGQGNDILGILHDMYAAKALQQIA